MVFALQILKHYFKSRVIELKPFLNVKTCHYEFCLTQSRIINQVQEFKFGISDCTVAVFAQDIKEYWEYREICG